MNQLKNKVKGVRGRKQELKAETDGVIERWKDKGKRDQSDRSKWKES